MKIEEAAKQLKANTNERNNYGGPISNYSGPVVNISKAINGFVVLVNNNTVVCNDLGELQVVLEKYFE